MTASTRVAVLVAVLVAVGGCGDDPPSTSSTDGSPPHTAGAPLTLVLDMPELRSAAEVSWPITLTNRGEEPVTLTFTSGLDADVELTDADGVVAYRWSDGRMFTQAIRHRSLAAGASLRFTLSGVLEVPAGSYTARVVLAGRPAPPPLTRNVDVERSGPPPKVP